MTMRKKHRICPFCKSHDIGLLFQVGDLLLPLKHFVFCWNCKARGPEAKTKHEALKLWDGICTIFQFKQAG